MRYLLTFCALAAIAPLASAQPRHGGVFAYAGGDCGTTYVTTRPVPAYAVPQAVGTPVRQVDAGRRVEPNDRSDELTVVRSPGRLVARRDLEVPEWAYFDPARTASRAPLRIPRGTRVEVLGDAGDGYAVFRMGGAVYSGQGTTTSGIPVDPSLVDAATRQDFVVESFPETEVWVRLVARGGRPAAWLNTRQPGVRLVDNPEAACE
jgi:hypothetical protein